MAAKNTDFLKFNAYAIKDLIVRKLSENSDFTDQLYEGSNLNILIDIFSYICQTLLFSLNTAAAESMFADTQLYENINRLCTFLGYNPKGLYPSTAEFILSPDNDTYTYPIVIPEYSYINIGSSDMHGKAISYTTRDQIKIMESDNHRVRLLNGRWKLYSTVYTATGEDWQTIILDQLQSDFDKDKFVADYYMDVYAIIYKDDGTPAAVYKYRPTSQQLFKPIYSTDTVGYSIRVNGDETTNTGSNADSRSSLYSGILGALIDNTNNGSSSNDKNETSQPNDNVFNLRLNENKQYVITFGDGKTGAKPPTGASIYIVYLDTNGLDGTVTPNEIVNGHFSNDNLLTKLQCAYLNFSQYVNNLPYINVTSTSSNSPARIEESVETIRTNAPAWFRMGNRLVTKDDYEYYLKTSPLMTNYVDVKCQNNWEYITTFYRWLYLMGEKYHAPTPDNPNAPGGRYYLNQNNIYISGKRIADPADGNNIYVWCIPSGSALNDENFNETEDFTAIKTNILPIKDMTHDLVFMRAIPVYFEICAMQLSAVTDKIKNGENTTGYLDDTYSYLEITVDDNLIFNNASISNEVYLKLVNYFIRNRKLGRVLNYNDLLSDIYDIHGITNIRTVHIVNNDQRNAMVYNGISFLTYTSGELVQYDDCEISNSGRTMEVFQYPELLMIGANDISKKIKIIKKSASNINSIGY